MSGLIYKDLCNLKKYMKQLLAIIVVMSVIFAGSGGDANSFISAYVTLLSIMVVISSISYDEYAKWDKYALTMPISRKMLVGSKYVLGMVMSLIGAVISTLLYFITQLFLHPEVEFLQMLLTVGVTICVCICLLGVLLPLLTKFGAEKARMMVILVASVPTAIITLLVKSGFSLPSEDTVGRLLSLLPFITILIYGLSYLLSVRIAAQKEY